LEQGFTAAKGSPRNNLSDSKGMISESWCCW
jgi:hypothetical protein